MATKVMYNTIIIGGGVAGLTAGMYLARANTKCLIFEGKFWGGQTAMLNLVANYPALPNVKGFELANNLLEQAKSFGLDMKNEIVTSVEEYKEFIKVVTNKGNYICQNVIVATGAKTGVLGLDKEKAFVGKGVSYCATCDGNFFKNKNVAVAGFGKTAIEDIQYLNALANKIYWIIPNKSLTKQQLKEIENLDKLEIMLSSEVLELVGESTLEGIKVLVKEKNKIINLQVKGLFVSLNRQPDFAWLNIDVRKDKKGYIIVNKNCQTSNKHIFACGDIVSRDLKQIVVACSDGAMASSFIITNSKT